LQTSIITNGTLLVREVVQELVDAGLSQLWVSLDGAAAQHDRMRGVEGAFARVARGLELALELRTGPGAPTVGVNFTLSGLNVGAMSAVADECRRVGADQMTIRVASVVTPALVEQTWRALGPPRSERRHHYLGLDDALRLSVADLTLVEEDLRRTRMSCEEGRVALGEDPLLTEMIATGDVVPRSYGEPGCPIVKGFLQMSPDGHLVVCPMLVGYPIGTYPGEDPATVWGNESHQEIAARLANDLLPICSQCCYRLW
jgi:MoaA/NifB/PqqE/SkfB family radical SAM enzyme